MNESKLISFLDTQVDTQLLLTDTIFETGASGVPSKSQKPFICGGVGQTITLKSPGKGATPSTLTWGLQ